VWFASLGVHHDAIVAYWRKKYEAIALCRMAGDPELLPQLMAARKTTPALRRFKKKIAAREEAPAFQAPSAAAEAAVAEVAPAPAPSGGAGAPQAKRKRARAVEE
jgi:hypothetical protein